MPYIQYEKGQLLGNNLIFLEDFVNEGNRKALFECHCGKKFVSFIANVKRGHTTSCGCIQSVRRGSSQYIHYKKGDTLGEQCIFIEDLGRDENGRLANFQCRCGRNFSTHISSVKSKYCTSCGCVRVKVLTEKVTIHGMSNTPEFKTWVSMLRRCNDPKMQSWENYGGRGIQVCSRWKESFLNFFEDMGRKPSSSHSLERIKNDNNYEPSNCKWATIEEQSNNKRTNVFLELDGLKLTIEQWSKKLNMRMGTIWWRYNQGWRIEKVLDNKYISRFNNKGFLMKHDAVI